MREYLYMVAELVYPDESYYILGLCYQIQNKLGPNQKERQYADALEILLLRDKRQYVREHEIKISFGGGEIGGNRVDFLFGGIILVDLKAKTYITREDYKQMIRYLEASSCRLGMIINFHGEKVSFKRVVNSNPPRTQ